MTGQDKQAENWCAKCGCGNDSARYAHAPLCSAEAEQEKALPTYKAAAGVSRWCAKLGRLCASCTVPCPPAEAEQQAPSTAAQEPNIEAAAKKLAECMDYPWEHMPEQGRQSMRENARRVLQAAHKGAQGEKENG